MRAVCWPINTAHLRFTQARADDVRVGVQERLRAELERRTAAHDLSVLNALRAARGLN